MGYADKIMSVLDPAVNERTQRHYAEKYGAEAEKYLELGWQVHTPQERWDLRQTCLDPRLKRQAIGGVLQALAKAGEKVRYV
ncbi:MAG: hypothetical protein WBE80_00920 [Methylocella sp.]